MLGKGITVYLFLRKSKRGYYENLNIKNITDNKLFWKSVKPLLSERSHIGDRINISEKSEILKTESETAETLNFLFKHSKEFEYFEIQ